MPLTEEEYKAKCEAFKKEINAPSILIMAVSENKEHICYFMEAQNVDRIKFISFLCDTAEAESTKLVNELMALNTQESEGTVCEQ